MTNPKVISLEGIDGSGKSTVAMWLKERLEALGIEAILLREPGSTPIGETLRNILLRGQMETSSPWVDVLLFYAARIENIEKNIRPALERGVWVILDRFQDATIAYQGYGQGLDVQKLEAIYRMVSENFTPEWTVLLDCPVDVAEKRLSSRNDLRTRWERLGRDFFERVRKGYIELARKNDDRFTIVDASMPLNEVYAVIDKALMERLQRWNFRL
ncbi:MAG: dTMP kinase [Thermodesulforhabdaceae bacterium]